MNYLPHYKGPATQFNLIFARNREAEFVVVLEAVTKSVKTKAWTPVPAVN